MKNCNMKAELPPEVLQEIVRGVMPRDSLAAVDFVVEALLYGKSFDNLERRRNIDGMVAPLCRNTFYKKKRLVIHVIQKGGEGFGENRQTKSGNRQDTV